MASLFSTKLQGNKIAWTVQWYENGRPFKKYLGTVSKNKAKAIKVRLENELLDKKHASLLGQKPDRITVSQAFKLYSKMSNISTTTIKRYNNSVNGFILSVGDLYLDEISINHLCDWKTNRLEVIKDVTFNIDHRQLHAIFEWTRKNKYISENPMNMVQKIKVERKIRQVMNPKEIQSFFNAITDKRDQAYFLILYFTGCRAGEVVNLKWDEILYDENGIAYCIIKDTKNGAERKAVLTDEVMQILNSMPKITDRIFNQINYDKEVDRSRPSKIFKKYLKKAGLPTHYSPKWFRHNFASHSMRFSHNPTLVKDILGHSTLQTTDIYTHTDLADYKKVAELLPSPISQQ